MESNSPVQFIYKNYRGEVAVRTVRLPFNNWYGTSKFHKGDQWFITCYDFDKKAYRDFAISDILEFNPKQPVTVLQETELELKEVYGIVAEGEMGLIRISTKPEERVNYAASIFKRIMSIYHKESTK